MIEADAVTVHAPGRGDAVIREATFRVPESDLSLVVGPSGAGKSTLLQALAGLIPHTMGGRVTGALRVAGQDPTTIRPRELAEFIGFVPQNPLSGFVTDVVEDEIVFGMEQLGLAPSVMRKRAEETLDLMGIADLRARKLLQLSGGQQQRVAIAAVLAAQPRVLLLDEPTSALDPNAAQDVLGAITTLVHEVGLTVVLAEHRVERVMQWADSILWLPGDGAVFSGPAEQVLAQVPEGPPLVALAHRLGWPDAPLTVRQARRRLTTMPGIAARPRLTETHVTMLDGTPVARLCGLRVRYGEIEAVAGVDMVLHHGQAVALMGRNGSGKSSLLWALQGAVPSSGLLEIAGEDPRRVTDERARELVSLVPQSPSDLLYLPTVAKECAQADAESNVVPGTTAGMLTDLGFSLDPTTNPRDLSEGQRLALVLSIQLASRPLVVCLDEPTRGLDQHSKNRLAAIVSDLIAAGTSVVIATHDVEFAAIATQRTVILAEGEVIADGPTRLICCSSPTFSPQLARVFHPADIIRIDDLPKDYRG